MTMIPYSSKLKPMLGVTPVSIPIKIPTIAKRNVAKAFTSNEYLSASIPKFTAKSLFEEIALIFEPKGVFA